MVASVRGAGFWPIRSALLLAILLGPSCFSLPKVGVIRVIDDFTADAGPTWNAFGPWTCGPHADRAQPSEGGQDAAPDGGLARDMDAGEAVSCTLAIGTDDTDPPIPPGTVTRALVASFDLTTPSNVEVVTRTKPPAVGDSADAVAPSTTVNLTGFSELIFNARLLPITASLPTGTELHVELHCSSTDDPLVEKDISALTAGVVSWKAITLPFSDFTVAAQREACLATVQSIAFVVVPGSSPPGTKVSGTLQLDNIRLQ
jgi:hypothetical protein